MKGIWLRLDEAVDTAGWFAATAIDGNGNPVSKNVNGQYWNSFGSPYGSWNPDYALRGDLEDITRNPYVQNTSPVWLGWGSAGLGYLQVNLHEQNGLPFKPTDSSCLVYPFYVTVLPG
jgi:hypothetical protein